MTPQQADEVCQQAATLLGEALEPVAKFKGECPPAVISQLRFDGKEVRIFLFLDSETPDLAKAAAQRLTADILLTWTDQGKAFLALEEHPLAVVTASHAESAGVGVYLEASYDIRTNKTFCRFWVNYVFLAPGA